MVRAVKSSTESTVAPVVTKPKAVKKPKVVESVAPVAVPVQEPVVESVDSVIDTPLLAKMSEYANKIQQLTSLVSSLKNDYKNLEKTVARELKTAQKASKRKNKRSGNRAPSGFVKPTLISDELAAFLGKDKGTELARTAVSKEINAYIVACKLQDPANGRKINADAKLAKLLKLGKDDELTYFNLQRYMKHHFIKKTTPVA